MMLSTPPVTLRRWLDTDETAYEAIVCTPEVAEFLGDPDSDPVPQSPLLACSGTVKDGWASVCGAVIAEERVVGAIWASVMPGEDTAHVTLGLSPEMQGLGIGRAAIAEAAKLLRSARPGVKISGTVRRDNLRCTNMVRRLGGILVPDPDDPDYYIVEERPT